VQKGREFQRKSGPFNDHDVTSSTETLSSSGVQNGTYFRHYRLVT
jgi:hypothetical protein